jgi:hypothetical protein
VTKREYGENFSTVIADRDRIGNILKRRRDAACCQDRWKFNVADAASRNTGITAGPRCEPSVSSVVLYVKRRGRKR